MIFATMNDCGVYEAQEQLVLPMPRKNWRGSPLAAIDLVETPEGWRAARHFLLPERGATSPLSARFSPAFPTRDEAITYAVERLRNDLGNEQHPWANSIRRWLDTLQPAQGSLL